MIKDIIIALALVVLFLLSIVMLYILNDGPDKLTDYIKKKKLAGRNANQKFKDLGYEMASSNVYYKFKKVPVFKTHRVNGEDIITKDDKEEVEKRMSFYNDEVIIHMDNNGVRINLEELDAISTKVIELGWLKKRW